MTNFENMRVLILDDNDFTHPDKTPALKSLNEAAAVQASVADIVIHNGKILKNRVGEIARD